MRFLEDVNIDAELLPGSKPLSELLDPVHTTSEQCFRRSVQHAPDCGLAHFNWAVWKMRRKMHREAVGSLNAALQHATPSLAVAARCNRAVCLAAPRSS